jgi:hypothetical protein
MSLMTYFRNTLTCLHCKQAGTAWVRSRLGDRGATYQIGDRVDDDIPLADIEDVSLKVRSPQPDEPVHILLSWKCEHCGLTNFADVVLAGGCVRSIDAVELDPSTLARLHYISETVEDMLETLIGERLYNESGVRSDWLAALRRALEAGNRW